jgi:hypothetical protein
VVAMTVGLGVEQGGPGAAIPAREANDLIRHGGSLRKAYADRQCPPTTTTSPTPLGDHGPGFRLAREIHQRGLGSASPRENRSAAGSGARIMRPGRTIVKRARRR